MSPIIATQYTALKVLIKLCTNTVNLIKTKVFFYEIKKTIPPCRLVFIDFWLFWAYTHSLSQGDSQCREVIWPGVPWCSAVTAWWGSVLRGCFLLRWRVFAGSCRRRLWRGIVERVYIGKAQWMHQSGEYSRPAAGRCALVQQGRRQGHLLVSTSLPLICWDFVQLVYGNFTVSVYITLFSAIVSFILSIVY